MNVDRLQEGLQTNLLGKRTFFMRKVGSTNDWAKKLASLGAPEGTVTIAETQTAGRGRLDKEWASPKGGLWLSVILRPKNSVPAEAVNLVFVAGLAVAEVLRELYDLPIETKWPNDVLVNDRKVCGILTEMNTTNKTVNYVVVGIGINANLDVEKVFQGKLSEVATSLEKELGRTVDLDILFKTLLERLECLYELSIKEGFKPILSNWKGYARFLGHQIEVTSHGGKQNGLAHDVEADGALIVRFENGTMKRILEGDVSIRGKSRIN
jgi:BirA family biotin operon repressor/biotin-[acetyl-CoA-carboxylase] ligase